MVQNYTKAMVLFSGGMDSTVCLHWAMERHDEVIALLVDYGQVHSVELESAKQITDRLGIAALLVSLPEGTLKGDSTLLGGQGAAPGAAVEYVPMRNMLLLALAANRAVVWNCHKIVFGATQTDMGGFPDCGHLFLASAQRTIDDSLPATAKPLALQTPLRYADKQQVVEMAAELSGCMESLALSHTCYRGVRPGCGKCSSCRLRAEGFDLAGVEDPLFSQEASR